MMDALLKEHPPHLQDAYEVSEDAELPDGTTVDAGTIVCEDCCQEISDVIELDGLEGINTQAQCDLCNANIRFAVTYNWALNLNRTKAPSSTSSEHIHHLSNALNVFMNPRIMPDLDDDFLPEFISTIEKHIRNHQP